MPALVFWLDVDNTLIDNDDAKREMDERIRVQMGDALADRYWDLYEKARTQEDVVDIPLALKWLREQTSLSEMDEETYQHVCSIFNNFPFAKKLYPGAFETLHYLDTLGRTVIVSDGDPYFQAGKIYNSGLAETVEGRVLIYIHKQQHLDEIQRLYPADHYVMIDDKAQILADSQAAMGERLTTVFVIQGKYATQPPAKFTPGITVSRFGDLRAFTAEQFLRS